MLADAIVTAAGVVDVQAVLRAVQSDVRLRQDAHGWYALHASGTYRLSLQPIPVCACGAEPRGQLCDHLALLRLVIAVCHAETAEDRIGIADALARLELLEARVERVLGGAA